MGKLPQKKYLIGEILESALKKENTSKKKKHPQKQKEKDLNTSNLVSSILFYHWKFSLLFFFIPIKIHWKHVIFKTIESHWRFISSKRLFLTFCSLTVTKYQNLYERNSKCKKYEHFLVNNLVFKLLLNLSSYNTSCKEKKL